MNDHFIKDYANFFHAFDEEYIHFLLVEIQQMGFELNKNGQLFYQQSFKPLTLNYQLLFVRHGETFGNCGQATKNAQIDLNLVSTNKKSSLTRVFQGQVDYEINQLTDHGKQQAIALSKHLDQLKNKHFWQPDHIYHSPLKRAKETAAPFVNEANLHDCFEPLETIAEMSFGAWDNRRVCDLPINEQCHAFYKEQNALVKKTGLNGNGDFQHGECFLEVLLRAKKTLLGLNHFSHKTIIMFSHSIFGAACMILLDRGFLHELHGHIAFDGEKKDGSSYCLPNAMPIACNFDLPPLDLSA